MIPPRVLAYGMRHVPKAFYQNHFVNETPGITLVQEPMLSEATIPAVKSAGEFAYDKVMKEAVFSGLYYYARKKPLTFAGRVIGHGLPFIGWAMFAYDIGDYFLND